MGAGATTLADREPQYGDALIAKAKWVLVAVVVIGEIIAFATGLTRSISFRVPFIVGVLMAAGFLYSFARTPVERRPQKLRSIAIALVLTSLVAMFYAATIVRLGGNVFNRPL